MSAAALGWASAGEGLRNPEPRSCRCTRSPPGPAELFLWTLRDSCWRTCPEQRVFLLPGRRPERGSLAGCSPVSAALEKAVAGVTCLSLALPEGRWVLRLGRSS